MEGKGSAMSGDGSAAEIVRLSGDRVDEAGAVLAAAFQDDPFVAYLLPDPERRRGRAGRWFMTTGVRYALRYGEVYATGGDVAGAAVWLAPGGTEMTVPRMARAGMLAAPLRIGPGAFVRLMRFAGFEETLQHRHAPGPHWYLIVLGVDPAHQGEGIGGRLIAPVLAKADAAGRPCYLETMSEANLAFYRRHGFEVVGEGAAPAGGPYVWAMRREPADGDRLSRTR